MSLIIVETLLDEPITFARLNEEEERLIPCLTARQATWQYSLLSDDRHRMICIYKAPDAESIRTGYHRANVFFSRTWAGELLEPEKRLSQQLTASRVVMEAISAAFSSEEWSAINDKLLHQFSEQGIAWLRTYRSLDRTTVIWELDAPNVQSVQAAQQQTSLPCHRIWSAELLNPEVWAGLGFSS